MFKEGKIFKYYFLFFHLKFNSNNIFYSNLHLSFFKIDSLKPFSEQTNLDFSHNN